MTVVVHGLSEAIAALERVRLNAEEASLLSVTAGGGILAAHLRDRAPKGQTHHLEQSIAVRNVRREGPRATADIGAAVDYDRFYQKGTSRQPPRPYALDAAEEAEPKVVEVAVGIFRAAVSKGGR